MVYTGKATGVLKLATGSIPARFSRVIPSGFARGAPRRLQRALQE